MDSRVHLPTVLHRLADFKERVAKSLADKGIRCVLAKWSTRGLEIGSIDSSNHRAWYMKFYIENPNVGVCILIARAHPLRRHN